MIFDVENQFFSTYFILLGGVGWSGLEWTGVEWSGVEWSGLGWSGLGWAVTLPVFYVRSRRRDQSTSNQSNRRQKSYGPNKRSVPFRPASL